jgi:hypothetical protein
MLPPFIIEQIRQREEKERARESHQPRLELPLDRMPARPRGPEVDDDDPNRGVIILDLLG